MAGLKMNTWSPQNLQGISRDRIAVDNDIGAGTVTSIIGDFKKGVQDSDFSSVRVGHP